MKQEWLLRGRRPASIAWVAVAFMVVGLVLTSGLLVVIHARPLAASSATSARSIAQGAGTTPASPYPGSVATQSIPVGAGPTGVAYDSANDQLFVTNGGSDNVTVIQGDTDAIVGSIPVGSDPTGPAYDPRNGDVYVANMMSANVSVLNGTTDKVVETVPVEPYPLGVTYDSSNDDLYVEQAGTAPTTYQSGNLTIINGTTNVVTGSILIGVGLDGGGPDGVAYDGANGNLYVSANYLSPMIVMQSSDVVEVNGSTNTVVSTTQVGDSAAFLDCAAYDPKIEVIDVCNWAQDYVSLFSAPANAVLTRIPVGVEPIAAAFDPSENAMAVVNNGTDNVTLINATLHAGNLGSIPVGSEPDAVAYDARNHGLYVADWASDNVTVIGAITPPPPATFSVTFTESGLPRGTPWTVNLNGTLQSSTGSYVVFSEPNGTYDYMVYSWSTFEAIVNGGQVQVNASDVDISVQFAPTAWLEFDVAGLPSDVVWTLTVWNGSPHRALISLTSGPENGLQLICNMTYSYSVTFPGPYAIWNAYGNVTLALHGTTVNISIPSGISAASVPPWTQYGLIATIVTLIVGTLVVVLWRRPPSRDDQAGHP
ncbi:MAG: YncE family protein [Thermoplasmata archaeon]|jgi:YVTN family beta-propeller protein